MSKQREINQYIKMIKDRFKITGNILKMTTTERTASTPPIGVLVVDETLGTLYLGDGSTAGGKSVMSVLTDAANITFGADSDFAMGWDNTNSRLGIIGSAAGVSNVQISPRARLKVHNRLGASSEQSEGGNTLEVRARCVSAAISHQAVDSIMYLRPDTTVTGGDASGVCGQLWVDTGKTVGGTTYLSGVRAQVYNNGTVNGAATCISGMYSIFLKDGTSAVWTSANFLANIWLDCHLESTPTTSSGIHFIVASNNGAAGKCTYNSVLKVFGEGAVTNLFELTNCSGMATAVTGAVGNVSHKVKVNIEGTTGYLVVYDDVAAS